MDQIFIDLHKRRDIKVLFSSKNLPISSDGVGTSRLIKKFNICVEKVDLMNLCQIRLTEVSDHTDMHLCTIDNDVFERIKVEQAINVSFNGFVDHLIKILEGCKKEELFISILEEKSQKFLQLYEKRPFKNLTHLYLPLMTARTQEILFHINQALEFVQSQLLNSRAQGERQSLEIATKDEVVQQMKDEIRNLNQKLYEQENLIFNRNTEEVNRLQQTIKHMQDSKDTNEKKMKLEIRTLQDKIDSLTREVHTGNDKFVQETKRREHLQEEINRLNSYISQIKDSNQQLQNDMDQCKSKEQRMEHKIAELQKLYNESQESLRQHQKHVQELSAEVEAERNIAQTKRNALQMATEEISSANRIIIKQTKEIEKLKNKIDVRTEVALQQEKVMQLKEKENQDLQNILIKLKEEFDETRINRRDFIDTIDNLHDSVAVVDAKYQKRIKDLNLDLERANVVKSKSRFIK